MINIIIAAFQILPCIVIPLFWIQFFLVETKNPENSEVYIAFEKSFPLPEFCWAIPCFLLSAIGLLTGEKYGYLFSIAAGSVLIFIGLFDISFNLQNGVYKGEKSKVAIEIIFNIYAMILGPISIIFGWINL
jgi:hypothetical protein